MITEDCLWSVCSVPIRISRYISLIADDSAPVFDELHVARRILISSINSPPCRDSVATRWVSIVQQQLSVNLCSFVVCLWPCCLFFQSGDRHERAAEGAEGGRGNLQLPFFLSVTLCIKKVTNLTYFLNF